MMEIFRPGRPVDAIRRRRRRRACRGKAWRARPLDAGVARAAAGLTLFAAEGAIPGPAVYVPLLFVLDPAIDSDALATNMRHSSAPTATMPRSACRRKKPYAAEPRTTDRAHLGFGVVIARLQQRLTIGATIDSILSQSEPVETDRRWTTDRRWIARHRSQLRHYEAAVRLPDHDPV